MKFKIMRAFIICTLVILCNSCASQAQIDTSIDDVWTVYKYKIGPIAAITIEEASLLKNQEIEISKTQINEFGASFRDCTFEQSKIDIEEYFYSFKFDYQLIDLKFKGKETILYSCNCNDSNGSQTYFEFIKNGKELIYTKEGFFFHLRRS